MMIFVFYLKKRRFMILAMIGNRCFATPLLFCLWASKLRALCCVLCVAHRSPRTACCVLCGVRCVLCELCALRAVRLVTLRVRVLAAKPRGQVSSHVLFPILALPASTIPAAPTKEACENGGLLHNITQPRARVYCKLQYGIDFFIFVMLCSWDSLCYWSCAAC